MSAAVARAAPAFRDVLAAIESPAGIAPTLVEQVFDAILTGDWTPVQIAGFLIALRLRGETAGQIAAAARALRAHMVVVDHGLERVLDTCGTGGDSSGTVNLSTGSAILAAACGVPVAKHGNRAITSQAGSADVLAALGIPLDVPPAAGGALLAEVGLAFFFAPTHHPALRHAMPVRRELGVRTLFNVLGPLANPARATHQLLGTFDDALRPVLAATLAELGVTRAWVVRGSDGLDELTPYATTRITEVDRGVLRELELGPEDFGLEPSPPGAAAGGDAEANAAILLTVLRGQPHPARTAFVLNAAAALVVADGLAPQDATQKVLEALDSGRALHRLDAWRAAALASRLAPEA